MKSLVLFESWRLEIVAPLPLHQPLARSLDRGRLYERDRMDRLALITGEYALTRLAAGVVEYFLADEALTRESLTLLTGTLRAQLAEILAAAKKAQGEEAWRTKVAGLYGFSLSGDPRRLSHGEVFFELTPQGVSWRGRVDKKNDHAERSFSITALAQESLKLLIERADVESKRPKNRAARDPSSLFPSGKSRKIWR
jgi:hypothetical protein